MYSYFIWMLPAILLSLFASYLVKSTFAKYSRVMSRTGLTGAQAAWKMLTDNGINDVSIEVTNGFLSDHYDPRSKTLRLSQDVYGSTSLSAIGVACHEAGHALQHANNYGPLALRSTLVPVTNFGSTFSYIIILAGFFMRSQGMILVGAALFSLAVLFAFVTLPVEWDASSRAKKAMIASGIVSSEEASHAGSVLNAAFLTYLAGAVSALLTLLRYLAMAGLFGGGDD